MFLLLTLTFCDFKFFGDCEQNNKYFQNHRMCQGTNTKNETRSRPNFSCVFSV